MIVAEQAQRFSTIGIDCVAMNVNDLICVGAEPLALLDYLAVESADPALLAELAEGLRAGAEDAGVEIPGGEVCQLPEVIRGHPSPYGFDLVGSAFGTVALDAIIDGRACAPGDALIGLPASGVHSNGLTLARRVAARRRRSGARCPARRAGRRERRRRPARAHRHLRARGAGAAALRRPVHGLAHITGGGLLNLLRLGRRHRLRDHRAAAGARRCSTLIAELGDVPAAEMWEVFNMGCGFCAVVPAADAERAVALLAERHPGTAVIGRVTDAGGRVIVPGAGIEGEGGRIRAV